MDQRELEDLIDEIQNGREEDTSTDWKEKWWDFKNQKAQEEFLKDIAAMANANTMDPKVTFPEIGGHLPSKRSRRK